MQTAVSFALLLIWRLEISSQSGSYLQGLIDSLDDDLRYAIEVEGKWQLDDAANYEEVRDAIKAELESLRDHPNREETPLIYHLDVAAMYPNIILTNRSASLLLLVT